MSYLLPTTDQLLTAPELAILHALETGLAAAQRALLTGYPELQDDLCGDRPLQLSGSGWIADAIITQIRKSPGSVPPSLGIVASLSALGWSACATSPSEHGRSITR